MNNLNKLGPEYWSNKYGEQAEISFGVETEGVVLKNLLSPEKLKDLSENLIQADLDYGFNDWNNKLKIKIASLYKNVNPEDIMLTSGVSEATYLTINSYIKNNQDNLVVEFPAFQQLFEIPKSRGNIIKEWYLKKNNAEYYLDIAELEKLIDQNTKLIIINNPQNPTGYCIKQALQEQIINIAQKHNVMLYSNELFKGLNILDKKTFPSPCEINKNTLTASGFSKIWGCGSLRLGWIISNKQNLEKLSTYQAYTSLKHPAKNSIIIANYVLDEKNILVPERSKTVKNNLAFLKQWQENNQKITCIIPEDGLTALVEYDFNINCKDLSLKILNETKTLACPGMFFGQEKSLRIGTGLPEQQFQTGLKNISKVINKL